MTKGTCEAANKIRRELGGSVETEVVEYAAKGLAFYLRTGVQTWVWRS